MPIPYRQTTNKLSLSSQPSSAALTAHPIPVKPLNPLTFQHPHTKQPPVPPPTHRTDSPPAGRLHGRARCVGVSRWSYLASEAPDGKVLCGHQPQSKPHLSEPGTHQRTWRVMGRPARQKPQTLSMTRRNDRTRHDHAAAPLADYPFVPPHPTKKRAPRPKHPGTLPTIKLSNLTQRAAETSESPSHWKPSQSQPQDSEASPRNSHTHAEYKQYHQQP